MLKEYCADFSAMGTEIRIAAVAEEGIKLVNQLLERAEAVFHREETRFSRFLPDSELNCLNRQRRLDSPSPEFWDVLLQAQVWHRMTEGYFDPTILDALESAGYDRSFATLALDGTSALSLEPPKRSPASFSEVYMLEIGGHRQIRLTGGTRLDLGGIVKGWTVDRVRELLAPLGNYLIDAGGDIFAAGNSAEGPGWWIGVEDPRQPGADLGYLRIGDQAVATSAVYRRRWRKPDGSEHHHLIDPKTGFPTNSDIVSVTVLGQDVEDSEIYAKVALLKGAKKGLDLLLRTPGIEGQVVTKSGCCLATEGWQHAFVSARDLEKTW